nr:immunoglobulin heavy chain junction region [Mus musculus]MBK4189710.1 immunoglobulin heavy chain junction region [Mus musculus]MBK4189711.1 immunoglobulin heavy chain junction region [Mus musculus]
CARGNLGGSRAMDYW